jgi:hypothetical protein
VRALNEAIDGLRDIREPRDRVLLRFRRLGGVVEGEEDGGHAQSGFRIGHAGVDKVAKGLLGYRELDVDDADVAMLSGVLWQRARE